jgi:hypothetical protein
MSRANAYVFASIDWVLHRSMLGRDECVNF